MTEIVTLPTLTHEYDPWSDVLTVEGVKYAGGLFRDLGMLGAVGDCFEIVKREDGVVWLRSIPRTAVTVTAVEGKP